MVTAVRSISTGFACLLLLTTPGCSEDSATTRGGSGPLAGGGASPFLNGGNAGAPGGNTTAAATPGDLGSEPTLTGSFIWIANSEQGTVSKIDTRTMQEQGRYLTNPGGDGHPSRTSVGSTGAVAVANRGGGIGFLGQAGVTKIEADEQRCADRNGDGAIQTSTGADDILPWMQDECMAWWTPLDFYSNRPVSWAPGAGPDQGEKVWTAGATNCLSGGCDFSVLRLDGNSGAIEDRVEFSGLTGVSFVPGGPLAGDFGIPNYGPYGGASDAGGNFWGFTANTMHLFRVDAATLEPLTWPIPSANGYGITVDPQGRIFLCGAVGVTRFDPSTQRFDENLGAVALGLNGCMTDGGSKIWVGGGADGGESGLHAFDVDSLQLLESHDVGGAVKGVSIDVDGNVWGVGGGNTSSDSDKAFRLDPNNGTVEIFSGLVGAYSYSDMTGFGLETAGYVPVVLE